MNVDSKPVDFGERVSVDQQQIPPAIVVEIEETAPPTDVAGVARHSCRDGSVVKFAAATAAVQRLPFIGKITAENIEPPVAIVIGRCDTHSGHGLAIVVKGNAAQESFFD